MIHAEGLTKRYGTTVAVDALSFDVLPGRVTGFLGPNGAGKSTTLRMVLGLDTPASGSVTIGGRPYARIHRPLHEVGALLDAKAVHPSRSAFNHLLCLAQSNGIAKSSVGAALERVGMAGVAKRRAGTFSLGMSQRLGIAAALLGDPAVVIFDEPVNGLDPDGILWIRTLMRSLADEGRTVFVSSHLLSEMAVTADHLIVIGRGRLIAASSVDEFVARSSQNFVRVRSPQAADLARLLSARGAAVTVEADGGLDVKDMASPAIGDVAADNRITLHELAPHEASLEEAYMELTAGSLDYQAAAPKAVPAVKAA
jgi:ABC-2 type transport system ATP-binding protein